MSNHNTGVNNSKGPYKGNELQVVYEYLQTNIATATMAATGLNIYQPALCRRKRTLEKAGKLMGVKTGYCKITKCEATYLSTNAAWFPANSQLNYFSYE